MREYEKRFCDDLLRYGEIIKDENFNCDGILIRQYTILCDGCTYLVTKNNGEWVYITRIK